METLRIFYDDGLLAGVTALEEDDDLLLAEELASHWIGLTGVVVG